MSLIALVTDSTCDCARLGMLACSATIVPLHVTVGDGTFLDGVDIDPATFYRLFAQAGQSARSSQPSVGEFVQAYEELLGRYDAVVSVHIAGRLSGTVESAALAAEQVDPLRIRWVDSKQVSVGLGLVVQAAADAIVAGLDLERVVAAAETAGRNTRVWGVTPGLEVAARGGRVNPRMVHLADTVDLKPLIAFDEEGAAQVEGARVGFRPALRAIAHKGLRFAAGHQVKAAIAHAGDPAAAEYALERLSQHLSGATIPVFEAGAVITSHVGLGTVAIAVQRVGGAQ